MNTEKEQKIQRTEEIQDIIERMPQNSGRWVVYMVVGLTFLFFIMSWTIQYPEIISCPVVIRSENNPVKLVAKTNGKIRLLVSGNKQQIDKGEIIAYIENTADIVDVLRVDSLLDRINIYKLTISDIEQFPKTIQLGELTTSYSTFIKAITKSVYFPAEKQYRYQKTDIRFAQKTISDDLNKIQVLKQLKCNTIVLSKKLLEQDSLNYFRIQGMSESDWHKAKLQNNSYAEGYIAIDKEEQDGQNQLNTLKNKNSQLDLDQTAYQLSSATDMESTYNQLRAGIKQWIDMYAFIAPISGSVEQLDFIKDYDFIQSGQELFSVIPPNCTIEGNSYLSVNGSGKVALKQKVHIKVDNYPYTEYGIVEGEVSNISFLAEKKIQTSEKSASNVYLVTIKLPRELTTNYGTNLAYQPNLKGVAEIVTNKRRLIERLFDNLKYIAKEK